MIWKRTQSEQNNLPKDDNMKVGGEGGNRSTKAEELSLLEYVILLINEKKNEDDIETKCEGLLDSNSNEPSIYYFLHKFFNDKTSYKKFW